MVFGGASYWEQYQRREIKRFLQVNSVVLGQRISCVPLFPGSMLFNQIAIVGNDDYSDSNLDIVPRFDSLDAVYEALGMSAVEITIDGNLLLDCQVWWDGIQPILEAEIMKYCNESNTRRKGVVVLSGRYSCRIQKLCQSLAIPCTVIRPHWWCGASLLRLYRSAGRIIFVDTARSLDAAMVGVPCSLIVGDAYSDAPVFPALFNVLSQLACCIVVAPSKYPNHSKFCNGGFRSTENTQHDLLRKLFINKEMRAVGQIHEGLSTEPVIRVGKLWRQRWRRKVGNLRISTLRKSRKLVEDPRAFFKDSNLPCSNFVATFFPEYERVAGADPSSRRVP